MRLNTIVKIAVFGATIYAGIQFASAYVTRTQLSHILETEAMAARRHGHSKARLKQNIIAHMDRADTSLPYEMTMSITGIGKKREALRVELEYEHPINLHFWQVNLSMQAVGDAKPAM